MRRRTRRRSRGFTLIEVMISLGIMMIGAMGVIALQQHAIRSNMHARQLAIGLQIAQTWIERLKQDAQSWNAPGVPTASLYLSQIATATPNQFISFPPTDSDGFLWPLSGPQTIRSSRGFDYLGNDLNMAALGSGPPLFYCAAFRPSWVYVDRAMRVDVRVWWPRREFDQTTFGECDENHTWLDPGAPDSMFDDEAFHVVYLSTVVRMMPVTR